jgi:hypothetical protein
LVDADKTWTDKLLIKVEKFLDAIKNVWTKFKSVLDCITFISEIIVKILGVDFSFFDTILDFFGSSNKYLIVK